MLNNAQTPLPTREPSSRKKLPVFRHATPASVSLLPQAVAWASKARKAGPARSPPSISPHVRRAFADLVSSPRDATVTPLALGPLIRFSPRSVLRKDTRIDPKIAHNARDSWRAQPQAATGTFGVDPPPAAGDRGVPPPPVDPNFDCASVLEPSARDHAETGSLFGSSASPLTPKGGAGYPAIGRRRAEQTRIGEILRARSLPEYASRGSVAWSLLSPPRLLSACCSRRPSANSSAHVVNRKDLQMTTPPTSPRY